MNKLTVEKAFSRLGVEQTYDVKLKFSRKFSPYNANVKKIGNKLIFSCSRDWKKVSEEISIGLIQELLLKILRKKVAAAATINMELYNNFIKNLHLSAQKTEADLQLLKIFERVNEKYFNNSIETPNLIWGLSSRRRLATYDYHTDTINVSRIFKDADNELIAYLLYHEMLHKKLKFHNGNSRTIHHSRKFKELEKAFENQEYFEKRLSSFVTRKNIATGWLKNIF